MSVIVLTSSPQHCAKQRGLLLNFKFNKKLLYGLSTFFLSILSLVVLIYLILHPSKPQFYLKDASVYDLSVIAPRGILNSTIQATILSKNPNTRVGVYYDRVRAYASYKGQQITADATLPPFYQGEGDTNFLSAALRGDGLAVEPAIGYEVGRDRTAGKILLGIKLDGELKWKVGTWVSGRYRFDVDCVAVIGLGTNAGAAASAPPLTAEGTQCSTNL